MADLKKVKALQLVSKSVNKKGKLVGKNKKETKMLKAVCPHHRINKHGKVKPTFMNNGEGTCVCTMCRATFPAKFFKDEKLDGIIGDMKTVNEQAKFMAVATGAGNQTIDFFTQFGVMLANYKKAYTKERNVAEKQSNVKNKKKKKSYESNQYGSWTTKN